MIGSVTTGTGTTRGVGLRGRGMLTKVPEVALWFWLAKLITTAMGEGLADYLAEPDVLGKRRALLVTGGLLAVALLVQLAVRRYVPAVYWTVVGMVGIAGTLIADTVVQSLGVSVRVATVVFLLALLAWFGLWYLVERTLSIHSITTTRRELFYWAAVMITFALGTAAGDLTAFGEGWGFRVSIVLYAAFIGVCALAWARFGVNAVLTFWAAYVVTRPLGASVADYLGLDALDSLNLGVLPVGLAFLAGLVAVVGYLTVSRRDTPADQLSR